MKKLWILVFLLTCSCSRPTEIISRNSIYKGVNDEETPVLVQDGYDKQLTISENEEMINLLASGDVWQVSFAQSPDQNVDDLLEFMKFNADGTVFYSLFNGYSSQANYRIDQTTYDEYNDSHSLMILKNISIDDQIYDTVEIELWMHPGKNLDPQATVDYSSILLTFDVPGLNSISPNESGQTLLTTSGLSMDETNQVIADRTNVTQKQDLYRKVTPVDISTNEVVEICWNFFLDKGLSKEQTAGILGNIKEESDFRFQVTSSGGMYFGLFQLAGQRQAAMFEMGGDENIYQQLEYIWQENFTTGQPYSNKNYMALQTNTFGSDYRGGCIDFNEPGHTVEEYAIAWMMNVERCWTPQTDWQKGPERAASARAYYELLS